MNYIKLTTWLLMVSGFIFGILDRSVTLLTDGYYSATDLIQLFTALFYFVCTLFLYPKSTIDE